MKTSTRSLKAVYPYWVIGKIAVLLLIHVAGLHIIETVWRGRIFKRAKAKQKPKELLHHLNEPASLRDNCESSYSMAISSSPIVSTHEWPNSN